MKSKLQSCHEVTNPLIILMFVRFKCRLKVQIQPGEIISKKYIQYINMSKKPAHAQ